MSGLSQADSSSDVSAAKLRRLWVADLALLSVAFIWGVNIPVMKAALEHGITPYALNATRLVISAIVLVGCAMAELRQGIRPAAQLSRLRIFFYAMIVSVAYQYLFLMAVSRTTSANVALIMATVPMWTALGSRLFLKEILPPLAWLGLFLAFAGTLIVTVQREPTVVTSDNFRQTDDAQTSSQADVSQAAVVLTGNLIALAAALTWSGGTVFSRPLLRAISPVQLAACSATIGLPFHLMFAGPTLAASIPLLSSVPLQLCILYSGVLSTGLALAMWSYGVKHAGAAQATMFQNLSPMIAIGAAWIWRGEQVSTIQMVGGVMIIGGLIIMRSSRRG